MSLEVGRTRLLSPDPALLAGILKDIQKALVLMSGNIELIEKRISQLESRVSRIGAGVANDRYK